MTVGDPYSYDDKPTGRLTPASRGSQSRAIVLHHPRAPAPAGGEPWLGTRQPMESAGVDESEAPSTTTGMQGTSRPSTDEPCANYFVKFIRL